MRIWAGSRPYCTNSQKPNSAKNKYTCLLCYFLNDRMVHPSTDNGTIRLYNNVVFSAVVDDRLLLAEWMKLGVMCSEMITRNIKRI